MHPKLLLPQYGQSTTQWTFLRYLKTFFRMFVSNAAHKCGDVSGRESKVPCSVLTPRNMPVEFPWRWRLLLAAEHPGARTAPLPRTFAHIFLICRPLYCGLHDRCILV
jgi:hypothetical protein